MVPEFLSVFLLKHEVLHKRDDDLGLGHVVYLRCSLVKSHSLCLSSYLDSSFCGFIFSSFCLPNYRSAQDDLCLRAPCSGVAEPSQTLWWALSFISVGIHLNKTSSLEKVKIALVVLS